MGNLLDEFFKLKLFVARTLRIVACHTNGLIRNAKPNSYWVNLLIFDIKHDFLSPIIATRTVTRLA